MTRGERQEYAPLSVGEQGGGAVYSDGGRARAAALCTACVFPALCQKGLPYRLAPYLSCTCHCAHTCRAQLLPLPAPCSCRPSLEQAAGSGPAQRRPLPGAH